SADRLRRLGDRRNSEHRDGPCVRKIEEPRHRRTDVLESNPGSVPYRSRNGCRWIGINHLHYPVCLLDRNDNQVKAESHFAFLTVFHEKITRSFRHNRFEKNVVSDALYDESASAAVWIVEIPADDVANLFRKNQPG